MYLPAAFFFAAGCRFLRFSALLHLGHDVSDNPRSLLLYSTSRVRVNVQRRFRAAMLICFHAPSPLVYFGLFRINTMAHTLGMSIQQYQQKCRSKFYTLPRTKKSHFPEKSSEKRLEMPWVKVQVHQICQSPFWHLFVTLLKMGAKKPGSRSVSLHRDTNCHPG